MVEPKKQRKLGFKRCAYCPAVFPVSDNHVQYLKCLGEGHLPFGYLICQKVAPSAHKYGKICLQRPLLKEALEARALDLFRLWFQGLKESASAPVASIGSG